MGMFLGGLTTKPDVDALMATFDVAHGTRISYSDVCKVIGDISGYRFRTITNAWRKRIFREKLIRSTVDNRTFCFLTADEAHDLGKRDVHKIGRSTGRLTVHVEAVDATDLTGERQDAHNILRREAQVMLDAVRKSARTITGPKPIDSSRLRLAK